MRRPSAALIAALLFFAFRAEAKTVDERVYIVPAGQIDNKIIKDMAAVLPEFLPMRVRIVIEESKGLPAAAYEPSRNQYLALSLLDDIMREVGVDTKDERALIITGADLYMPDADFVFGVADAKNGACLISLARLESDYGLFRERAVRTALRELGRSWGLDYCPNPGCVMYLPKALRDADNKRITFCRDCRAAIDRRYHKPLFKAPLKTLSL